MASAKPEHFPLPTKPEDFPVPRKPEEIAAAAIDLVGVEYEELSVVGDALRADGVFCLYGPFRIDGRFNTESNERFDASLRQRDPAMGIRDLETLDDFGASRGLQRQRLYAMPSNNFIAVWTRPHLPR